MSQILSRDMDANQREEHLRKAENLKFSLQKTEGFMKDAGLPYSGIDDFKVEDLFQKFVVLYCYGHPIDGAETQSCLLQKSQNIDFFVSNCYHFCSVALTITQVTEN